MKNPIFSAVKEFTCDGENENAASYSGIAVKSFILLLITFIIGATIYVALPKIISAENDTALIAYIVIAVIGVIAGMIAVFVGRLSVKAAKICSFIYAIGEGLFLGGLTTMFELYFEGIGMIAILSTLIIFGITLLLFYLGVIRRGKMLVGCLIGVVAGILVLFIIDLALFLGHFYTDTSYYTITLLIQGAFVIFGVISLAFDFCEAEDIVECEMPKEYEWGVALGLEVSLVYIYVQMLRVLAFIARFVKK